MEPDNLDFLNKHGVRTAPKTGLFLFQILFCLKCPGYREVSGAVFGLGSLKAFFIWGNTMSENTITNATPSYSTIPITTKPFQELFYFGWETPEDRLSASLRGLKGLLHAVLTAADDETLKSRLYDDDLHEIVVLASDLVIKAKNETDAWQSLTCKIRDELCQRAKQLPEKDELWIKCNIIADRQQTTFAEQAAAVSHMIAQIEPVLTTTPDGTKTTFQLCQPQVRKGWSGEFVKDSP